MTDPLFPRQAYSAFLEAAQTDDPTGRRDALHQQINDLPDPNYATLRALVLHLHRVMSYEGKNRMGRQQLAVCWAPTLMLGDGVGGGGMQDTGLMVRVVETILGNATAIFDED